MEIQEYHSGGDGWRNPAVQKFGQLFGLELEVEHPRDRQIVADALDTFDPGEHPGPVAERDGSIDRHRGVEVILPPLPLAEVVGEGTYVARLLDTMRRAGTLAVPGLNYGLHVNINLDGWSAIEKKLVPHLICSFTEVGIEIGRRGSHEAYLYQPEIFLNLQRENRLEIQTGMVNNKYRAAHVRNGGQVMEVRFPHSTLDQQDIRNVIDYVFALREFVAGAPNQTLAACMVSNVNWNWGVLKGLFTYWVRRTGRKLAAPRALKAIEARYPVTTSRYRFEQTLERAEWQVAPRLQNRFIHMGVEHAIANPDYKEQAVRISTLISKGLDLKGEYHPATGRIRAETIRSAA
jgi:hypothetical protein